MGQEPTPTTPEGQAPPEQPPTPPEGNGSQPQTFDAEYVKSLRAEAAKHRREAVETKARLQHLEDAQLSETEKLKKDAEQGKQLAEQATSKLRNANLRDALSEKGFSGAQAKAVGKLLDGLEYGNDDEPTNLDARLEAAAEVYGDLVNPAAQRPRTPFDGGPRGNGNSPQSADDFIRGMAGRRT